MRRVVGLFVLGLFVLGAATVVHSRPVPEASEWDVEGLHNLEGRYRGVAKVTLDALDVRWSFEGTTTSGKRLAWTGKGKLVSGSVKLAIDPEATGVTGALSGAKPGETKARAEYFLGDEERSLSGYWSVTGKRPTKRPGPGGTETLTLRSGRPLLPNAPKLPPPRLPADALPVPLVTQPDDYSCGAASLQSILYYYRVSDGDLKKLYKPLKTSASNGTEPPEIVAFARERGLGATFASGKKNGLDDLRESLRRRDPVMLVIQAWKETTIPWREDVDSAHWVVLVGMDEHYAYFMDPWAHFGYGYIPLDELLDRWHCAEDTPGGDLKVVQHEAIYFRGFTSPKRDGLVRIQ